MHAKHHLISLFNIAILLIATLPATAQKKPFRDIGISQHDFVDTVKIKIVDGAPVIPVVINGDTKFMVFDTGAQWASWIGSEEEWMTASGDSLTVRDSQNIKKKKAIHRIPQITMGDLCIENYPVIVDDGLGEFTCGRFDGLLGFDLVARGLSFKFDTKDSLMIVTDRKGFFAKEERGQPMVKYKAVNKTKPMVWVKTPLARIKMLFDTGAIGIWFDLPENLILRWAKDDKKMQQALDTLTAWIDTTTLSSAGLYGLAYDTVTRRMIHYPEIELGGLRLLDLWESTDCNLLKMGSGVMKHASLIIDGPKKRFVFIPHDGKPDIVVDNENKMGLELKTAAPGDTLGVMKADVHKGSQAYEKGLRTGDYLVSIDGNPIESYCDVVAVRDKKKSQHYVFRSPEGTLKEIDW